MSENVSTNNLASSAGAPPTEHNHPDSSGKALQTVLVKSWKAPIAFGVFALGALILFVIFGRDGDSTFRLSTDSDLIQLPAVVLPTRATGIVITILLVLLAALSVWLVASGRKVRLWLMTVFAVL